MTAAKMSFSSSAAADYNAWNCKEMYPRPQQMDLDLPKWLGGITKMAKKGFAVYN